MVEITSGKPYIQTDDVRTFDSSVNDDDLVWHRDKYFREITVLEGNDWKLQLDNELPVILEEGKKYNIPAMEFHRVIKGTGNLTIKIWEEK